MNTFRDIETIFKNYGNKQYMIDEDITQYEHALQCAYFAHVCGAGDEIIVGLLLHDIGQLLGHTKSIAHLHRFHNQIGAEWLLKNGFPTTVVQIARYHTAAKIILCEKSKEYYQHLSQASINSLNIQKKYCSREVKELRMIPLMDEILAARYCDELGKVDYFTINENMKYGDELVDNIIPGLQFYQPIIINLLSGKYINSGLDHWKDNVKKLYGYMFLEQPIVVDGYMENNLLV